MPKERSTQNEEQEDPLEPWETAESRAESKAWRSDTEPKKAQAVGGSYVMPTNVLEWAVTNAPSVLRDLVVASLAQQVHELRGIIATLSENAADVHLATVPRELVRVALASAQAAAHLAFGEGFIGYTFDLRFDPDFGGAYVAVSLDVHRMEDAAFEHSQGTFFEELERILPPSAAERAIFSIVDHAAQ